MSTRQPINSTQVRSKRRICKKTPTKHGNDLPRILVVGLGNLLLGDDGVGIHAIRRFRPSDPRGITVAEVGTAVLDSLHLLARADKILAIDAIQAGDAPGAIYRMDIADIEQPRFQTSLHELSLIAALQFLQPRQTVEIVILGVTPEKIDYSLSLSSAVEEALPHLLNFMTGIVENWKGEAQPSQDLWLGGVHKPGEMLAQQTVC